MSLTFGKYGFEPLDEYSSGTVATGIDLNITDTQFDPDTNSNKTQYICVAGTLATENDSVLPLYSFKNDSGDLASLQYIVRPSISTTPSRSSSSTTGRLTRYNQGNALSTSSVIGERLSFIFWICEQSRDAAPYTNTHGYFWCATNYTSTAYYQIPSWGCFRSKTYGRTMNIRFTVSSGGLRGRVRSWKWGAE